jgi:spore maturation protein CgeB
VRAILVHPGPAFSVADVANGYSKALRSLGVQVKDFDLGDVMTFYEAGLRAVGADDTSGKTAARMTAASLRQTCFDWWPDVLFIVSAFFLPPELYEICRARGMRVVTILTESPYEDDNQARIAAWADVATVNDPTNLAQFPGNTHYLPHAYDPDVHSPGPVEPGYESDFCFVGTAYPERIKFFEAVDWSGLDVALAGNWSELGDGSPLLPFLTHELDACCPNDEAVRLYRATQVGCNVYRTSAQRDDLSDGWAMGPREVELAATGTFFLTQARGENREVLPMVPTFESPGDLSEQVRWWLAHPDKRADVATKAREAVADRTFAANTGRLLELAGL